MNRQVVGPHTHHMSGPSMCQTGCASPISVPANWQQLSQSGPHSDTHTHIQTRVGESFQHTPQISAVAPRWPPPPQVQQGH